MLGCAPPPPPPDPPSPPLPPVLRERLPFAEGTPAAPVVVAAADGAFLVAWESHTESGCALVVARRDASGTWGPPARLDDVPAVARPLEPQLAAGPDGRVVAAWQSGDEGIRVRTSPDGGVTWAPSAVVSDGGPATLPALAMDPRGRTFVAWEDRRDGDRDVRLRVSADAGRTWDASRRADSDRAGAAGSYHPRLAAPAPDVLLLLWWDERSGLSDLHVRRSADGGATWDGPEVRLDPGPPGAAASHAARFVRADPEETLVEWEEVDRSNEARVLRCRSTDLGATWSTAEESAAGLADPAAAHAVSAVGDTLIVRLRPGEAGPELGAVLCPAHAAADGRD